MLVTLVSKNLGHIPKQSAMDEAVEQSFTNGINKGRKLERERILGLRKELINCVINYGLTPDVYERVCADMETVIRK